MIKRLITLVIVINLVSCLLNPFIVIFSLDQKNANGNVKIAVFAGRRVWYEGKMACSNMFKWMNLSAAFVYSDDIRNGSLSDFDLLCIPGGWAYGFYEDLQEDGASKILDFVLKGGAYLGICAGAFYACEYLVWDGVRYDYPIGLFPGFGIGPLDEICPYPDYNMTDINIVNHSHPITSSEPAYEWILYYGGPGLHPYEGSDVTVLATYNASNQPAIVAFEYGLGRVFLSGPHPEIEEDSYRDGTSFGEEFDDQGSDWLLMHQAVQWLLLREDINGDGIVNISDLFIVAKACGSHGPDTPNMGDPASENWNEIADLNKDKWVNIQDMFIIARNYGNTV